MASLPRAKSVPLLSKNPSSSSSGVSGWMMVYGWDLLDKGKWVVCLTIRVSRGTKTCACGGLGEAVLSVNPSYVMLGL